MLTLRVRRLGRFLGRTNPRREPTTTKGNTLRRSTFISAASCLAAGAFLIAGPAHAASSTVRVDESPEAGWTMNPDPSNDTPFTFTTAQHSIGSGSLYVAPITNTQNTPGRFDKFIGLLDVGGL